MAGLRCLVFRSRAVGVHGLARRVVARQVAEGQRVVPTLRHDLRRDLALGAHRIQGDDGPLSARWHSSSGIAVISFDLAVVFTCPSAIPAAVAKARTRCSGPTPTPRRSGPGNDPRGDRLTFACGVYSPF